LKQDVLNVNNDHLVHTRGKSTLVTIKNRLGSVTSGGNSSLFTKTIKNQTIEALDSLSIDDDEDFARGGILDKKNFTNIKIKISNNTDADTIMPSRLGGRIGIVQTKQASNDDNDVEMEVEEAAAKNYKRLNDGPVQGYRLIISNLHETVSEDDIMVLRRQLGILLGLVD
jgi:hypothetical protein